MTGKKAAPPPLEEAHRSQRAEGKPPTPWRSWPPTRKSYSASTPTLRKPRWSGMGPLSLAEARRVIKAFAERKV